MRRLCGFITGTVLMTVLWSGCGSTDRSSGGSDYLVFQFLRFDNTGITQTDSVRPTSADVDNSFDSCGSVAPFTSEPFTNTTINAVFRNHEASDITLDKVVIDVGPMSGLPNKGVITRSVPGSAVIAGGRCSNSTDIQCGSDADCVVNGVAGVCGHTDTTISGILLFDVFEKSNIQDGTYGVRITFFVSDPNQSLEVGTSYTVTFADYNNCTKTGV
jgi:hypothetical protein